MNTQFFKNKSVLVTGGAGFIGRAIVQRLQQASCQHIIVPRRKDFDLTKELNVQRLFKQFKPDIVIHAAGITGGIEFSRQHPAELVYQNLILNTLVLEYARKARVGKFVGIGTVCSYPKCAPVPLREEDLWSGYPEETNAPYGLAKKMLLVQAQAYRQQYQFNSVCLLLANLYGPHDNFDLHTCHVIPALIRKFVEAKERGEKQVIAWGTGKPTREFLYVEDAAEGILRASEHYNASEPVNLGSGLEISIKELVHLIARLTGFHGEIVWNSRKPDGQPRRHLDTTKAERLFGFRASTPFEKGLRKTIEWYESTLNVDKLRA